MNRLSPRARALVSIGGRVVLALALLTFLLSQVPLHQVGTLLLHIQRGLALAAVAVILCVGFITTAKWLVLLRALDVPVQVSRVLRLSYIAVTWNLALPGGESGNLVKALLLTRQAPQFTARVWASLLVDQLSLALAQLVVALLTLSLTSRPPADLHTWLVVIAFSLAGTLLFYATFAFGPLARLVEGPIQRLSQRLIIPARFRRTPAPAENQPGAATAPGEWLLPFWRSLTYYRGHPRSLLIAAGFAVGYYGTLFGAYWLAARSLGIPFGYADIAWVTALAGIAALAPITIAGVGVREGIITYYLHQHGIATSQALTFSLVVLALNIVLGLPGLVLHLMRQR